MLGRLWISLYHEICVILGAGPVRAECVSGNLYKRLCKEMGANEGQ